MVIDNFVLVCIVFLIFLFSFFFIKNKRYRGIVGIVVGSFLILLLIFDFYVRYVQGTLIELNLDEIKAIVLVLILSFAGIIEGIRMFK